MFNRNVIIGFRTIKHLPWEKNTKAEDGILDVSEGTVDANFFLFPTKDTTDNILAQGRLPYSFMLHFAEILISFALQRHVFPSDRSDLPTKTAASPSSPGSRPRQSLRIGNVDTGQAPLLGSLDRSALNILQKASDGCVTRSSAIDTHWVSTFPSTIADSFRLHHLASCSSCAGLFDRVLVVLANAKHPSPHVQNGPPQFVVRYRPPQSSSQPSSPPPQTVQVSGTRLLRTICQTSAFLNHVDYSGSHPTQIPPASDTFRTSRNFFRVLTNQSLCCGVSGIAPKLLVTSPIDAETCVVTSHSLTQPPNHRLELEP